jgi:glycosyltransferase involved in cell wall biosynthesis
VKAEKFLSNPIRVLFLIDSFQMGGAERVTAALLPHFDRSRVTPLVCTLRKRGESPLVERLGDTPRFDLDARRMLHLRAFRHLLRLLRRERIDLIHAQLQDATIFAVAANKLTGVPVVVTRHLMADDVRNRRRRIRNIVERYAIRAGVARVITVSDAARDSYVRLTGMPLSRFQTIYNGIDLDSFAQADDKPTERRGLGIPTEGPLVTMVGVLRPGKGQAVAIEAARQLPGAHFLIVGNGEHRSILEEQARGLDNVHFLGQRMDVPQILRASDVLILPSDNEALPTVLIEGGASGLPTVATCVGGVPEIVEDGITGLLIPPQNPPALANAIRRLLDDPALSRRMGDQANRRVRARFTLPGQTAALADLYRTIVQEAS